MLPGFIPSPTFDTSFESQLQVAHFLHLCVCVLREIPLGKIVADDAQVFAFCKMNNFIESECWEVLLRVHVLYIRMLTQPSNGIEPYLTCFRQSNLYANFARKIQPGFPPEKKILMPTTRRWPLCRKLWTQYLKLGNWFETTCFFLLFRSETNVASWTAIEWCVDEIEVSRALATKSVTYRGTRL